MDITTASLPPSIRIRLGNPDHHIWDNNGTWFMHYTIYPSSYSKRRIRRSLRTKDIVCARQRRDRILARLASQIVYNEPMKITG